MSNIEKNVSLYEFRAFPDGKDRYDEFMKKGFMSLGWGYLGDVSKINSQEIKAKLRKQNSDYSDIQIGQIAGFFEKLKGIEIGDIILIPYIKNDGPIVTIATVTKKYNYNSDYFDDNMAQQIGIEFITEIDRQEIAEKYEDLNNSLKARLTLTSIVKTKHVAAINYINTKIAKNQKPVNAIIVNNTEEYSQTIQSIKDNIDKNTDALVVKSLILSALIVNEAYLKNKISEQINESVRKADDDVFQNIVQEQITNNLFRRDLRYDIGEQYFEKVKISKDYSDLRNSLAHNIMMAKLKNKNTLISFSKYKRNNNLTKQVNINKMFEELIKYGHDLKEINSTDE